MNSWFIIFAKVFDFVPMAYGGERVNIQENSSVNNMADHLCKQKWSNPIWTNEWDKGKNSKRGSLKRQPNQRHSKWKKLLGSVTLEHSGPQDVQGLKQYCCSQFFLHPDEDRSFQSNVYKKTKIWFLDKSTVYYFLWSQPFHIQYCHRV